jgi:hypothetical protein
MRLRRPFIRRGSPWAKPMALTDERMTEPDRHQKTPPLNEALLFGFPRGFPPNEVCTRFPHRFCRKAKSNARLEHWRERRLNLFRLPTYGVPYLMPSLQNEAVGYVANPCKSRDNAGHTGASLLPRRLPSATQIRRRVPLADTTIGSAKA